MLKGLYAFLLQHHTISALQIISDTLHSSLKDEEKSVKKLIVSAIATSSIPYRNSQHCTKWESYNMM